MLEQGSECTPEQAAVEDVAGSMAAAVARPWWFCRETEDAELALSISKKRTNQNVQHRAARMRPGSWTNGDATEYAAFYRKMPTTSLLWQKRPQSVAFHPLVAGLSYPELFLIKYRVDPKPRPNPCFMIL
jgi:hypothetical protein